MIPRGRAIFAAAAWVAAATVATITGDISTPLLWVAVANILLLLYAVSAPRAQR